MQSAQSQKPKRFDVGRRTTAVAVRKPRGLKEDKNMNTIPTASPRRVTKVPLAAPRTRVAVQPRAPVGQTRFGAPKQGTTVPKTFKPKPKTTRASAAAPVARLAPAPAPPPPPPSLPLDPNCNEPSLPCLCCDGRSPQDNNSMFNHNHNNNNTVSLRQQMQLPPPPPVLVQRQEVSGAKKQLPSREQAAIKGAVCPALLENDQKNVARSSEYTKKDLEDDEEESSADIDIDVDEDDNDEDDDTLVPSCCDCNPSLLEFSLSSSTSSSSSTSISSCSDLDSDSADQSESLCSSYCQDHLSITMSPKDGCFRNSFESKPPSRSPPSLPFNGNPFLTSQSAISSPDEGYPSALNSPSPDYLGVKGDTEVASLGLLDFLESVGEFGKMERFSQVIQVARWDLEGEQHWDVLRDRLDHLDRLEKVNREVKLYYIAKLHEKGYDLGDLDEQDLSDVLDEMGNIDIPLKLYKNRVASMADSQEFSDAGVDLTAPSDCEDPLPDSLTPSPVEQPCRPPKPPVRHASVNSDLHTYINISRETVSMAVTTSPTLTTFSSNSTSPTFTTFRCEKSLPTSPPSIPPLPSSKPIQYLSLYTTSSPPPSIPTPTPPIPPPRKRHLARKEAQRLAALQAEQESTPISLPPPTTSPPPLPPPPVISISCSSSPPAIPPPPSLPPPPSFHALDVEIRKLLMLAGLTQADLLKLSPELGVCVNGLEEEVDEDNHPTRQEEQYTFRLNDGVEKECDSEFSINDGWSNIGKQMSDQTAYDTFEGKNLLNESKDSQRKTSFTEMARRRKRNSGVTTDAYYTTGTSNMYDTKETFNYPSTPPPPPPPRPLPPIPPSLQTVKVSTLSANSARPERFDWLIAFTPEGDARPEPTVCDKTRPDEEPIKTRSSSGSSSGSGPRVTTFKELRNRNKNAPLPTKVITDPDPDPSIITPDPDILYNLKWRREKAGTDGSQWEYTSQAQALFMQPPPALTSMAALKEMLRRADQEGGKAELYPTLKISCPAGDARFYTTDRQGEEVIEEVVNVKVSMEQRGRADGRRTIESRTSGARGVSFAGAAQKEETSWMDGDVKRPVRGLSSACLQEKKALVSAVSQAVEAILGQFSSSRTVVQKALSGDSAINPSLGRLVLQCLCPALHRLLTDGLKPHQSDLIAGRRPNSAWGLVQASTRPGLKTQALYNLQNRVSELPQLRQSKHKFNAFVFGLLNTKMLDFWLNHLQTCSDVLDTFYHPSSFMFLSLTSCRRVYEELLLVLQPLSLLTFNLDLLFQHHHLETHSPQIPSPPSRAQDKKLYSKPVESRYMESLSGVDFGSPADASNVVKSSGGEDTWRVDYGSPVKTSPQLMWVQEKRIADLPPPNMEEDSLAHQAGQVIQQGWGAMVRLGGRLGQNLAELSAGKKEDVTTDLSDLPDRAVSDFAPVGGAAQVPWGLGRLFGASRGPGNLTSPTAPSRRPSQWLAPGVTALTRMMSTSSSMPAMSSKDSGKYEGVKPATETEIDDMAMDTTRPLRQVRMLCDHRGSGSELSFAKGEELVVLGGIDQDWIRCRRGDKEGLVQIGYTSIIM